FPQHRFAPRLTLVVSQTLKCDSLTLLTVGGHSSAPYFLPLLPDDPPAFNRGVHAIRKTAPHQPCPALSVAPAQPESPSACSSLNNQRGVGSSPQAGDAESHIWEGQPWSNSLHDKSRSPVSQDVNEAIEDGIRLGLSTIPVIGGFLATLIQVLWPWGNSNTDVWDSIKAQVEQLIDQKLEQQTYEAAILKLQALNNNMHDY